MNRRKFISIASTALSAASIPMAGLAASTKGETEAHRGNVVASQGRRSNVLILMSDQHKRSCMGVSGDTVAITPNIDRLAGESVRFTNTYCTNPVCGPSRASILTGLYTHHLEGRGNSMPYSPKHKTIANHFSTAGYFSALVGKMHFVDAQTHGFGYKLEFNDWWQYLGPKVHLYADELGRPNTGAGLPQVDTLWKEEGDPWKGHRKSDGRLGSVAVGCASEMKEEDHFESFVARESIRFLENYASNNEPFFLVSSFLKPHDPFMPAERFAEKFQAADMKLPPSWGHADLQHLPEKVRTAIKECRYTPELREASAARERMAYYYANLAQTDDCVGQVLSALDRLGLAENTIVVYTSDHGEMLGDLGLWNKFQFYEGSCGVPLMIRMPGGAPAVCEQPLSLISLTSTLAELCGVPMAGPSDGKSFAELVHRPHAAWKYGPVFAEYGLGEDDAKYMIRDGDMKYTYWVNDLEELYDLHTDPEEMSNLAVLPEHKGTVKRLREKLFAWHTPAEKPMRVQA